METIWLGYEPPHFDQGSARLHVIGAEYRRRGEADVNQNAVIVLYKD